jgi:hypothetical protein
MVPFEREDTRRELQRLNRVLACLSRMTSSIDIQLRSADRRSRRAAVFTDTVRWAISEASAAAAG